jgi:O-antigen ligase
MNIQSLQVISFISFFIFNFLNRDIANIFLIITLILCLLNIKALYGAIRKNNRLVFSILLFTAYISLVGFFHDTPLNELDNYYRFLLLLPLLLLSLDNSKIIAMLYLSAFLGLVLWLYHDVILDLDVRRYNGTSSSAITYANLSATMMILSLYYLFQQKTQSVLMLISFVIFVFLYSETETRGPIIGLLVATIYLTFSLRVRPEGKGFMLPAVMLSVILILIMIIPHPLAERIRSISQISFSSPELINDESLKERVFYITYGFSEIPKHFFGIGPQNVESKMAEKINENGLKIKPRDHLHNDFLDITLKFGFISLLLLLYIYYCLIYSVKKEHRIILNILMIMLVTSQLTQSHFAHHQATTFFLSLLYALQNNGSCLKKSTKISGSSPP